MRWSARRWTWSPHDGGGPSAGPPQAGPRPLGGPPDVPIGRGAVMNDWPHRLREHQGTLLAFIGFVAMFAVYAANHPAGLTANVATTAANKGVLLAIVAMAQTLVVLTSGIDLSVGMVLVLANCLASTIVVGSPLQTTLGVLVVMLVGVVCGAINALIVIFGRLQPIVTTIATG